MPQLEYDNIYSWRFPNRKMGVYQCYHIMEEIEPFFAMETSKHHDLMIGICRLCCEHKNQKYEEYKKANKCGISLSLSKKYF